MVPRHMFIKSKEKCLSVEFNSDLSFEFERKSLCFGNFFGQYYVVSVKSQPHHTPRTLYFFYSAANSLLKIAGLFLHVCI